MIRGFLASLAILGVAAGCASQDPDRSPVLPGDSPPTSHPPPPTPMGESSDDIALENWKSSVLDRADDETLDLIRKDLESRIQRLQETDLRLSYLPPGISLEERTRIAARIDFEKKRLAMVEQR